jgi:hypothetical protein
MIVKAWNNGAYSSSGAGYGLKITVVDRDRYFHTDWEDVILELEEYPHLVEVNVKKESFWGPVCRELISKDIGVWMRENGLAPWPKGRPPKLEMQPIGGRRFKISKIVSKNG